MLRKSLLPMLEMQVQRTFVLRGDEVSFYCSWECSHSCSVGCADGCTASCHNGCGHGCGWVSERMP